MIGTGGTTAIGTGGTTASGGAGGSAGSSGGGGGGTIADGGGASFQPQLGDWAGSTSQGESITFTVVAGGISQIHVAYAGSGCTAGLADLSLDSTTPIATITNNTFTDTTTRTSAGPLGTYTFAGTFSSASSASGTFVFNLTAIGSTDCGGSASATWTAAPVTDGGVACRLTNCGGTTSLTFTYSCATPSSTADSFYGVGVGTTLTVTYSNGHIVHCLNGPADGGTVVQRCTDDTGAVCTWTNPSNPPPADAGGPSVTPPCASGVGNGVACSASGESCKPAGSVSPVPCHCLAQTGGTLLWICPLPPPDAGHPGP